MFFLTHLFDEKTDQRVVGDEREGGNGNLDKMWILVNKNFLKELKNQVLMDTSK